MSEKKRKCIATTNIYGHPLPMECGAHGDLDDPAGAFHAQCGASENGRRFCSAHEPLYADNAATPPAFWLVWRDGYNSTPHYKHSTEADARAEAERLARNNPGHAFYVLPATSYAQCAIQPVTWGHGNAEGLEAEDVPF